MTNQKETNKWVDKLAGCYTIFMVLVGALFLTVLFFWVVKFTLAIIHPTDSLKQLELVIDELPDSSLKRNLYIILASEYTGDSEELNELMQAYSKMKIKELQYGKQL
jgi:hypothetical protein